MDNAYKELIEEEWNDPSAVDCEDIREQLEIDKTNFRPFVVWDGSDDDDDDDDDEEEEEEEEEEEDDDIELLAMELEMELLVQYDL